MISHNPKLIFIHVPKAAGSSIEFALQKYSSVAVSFEANGNAVLKNKHVTAAQVLEAYGKEKYSKYFSFAVARNPWERVVSAFFYLQSINHQGLKGADTVHDWVMKGDVWCEPTSFYVLHKGKMIVDQVLYYDNLDAEFAELCERLEIDTTTLPRNNSSQHQHYRNYFDTSSEKVIAKLFAEDIRHFSFDFDR